MAISPGVRSRRCFEAEQRPGLVEVLNSSALWRQSVVATGIEGLQLLPAGRGILSRNSSDTRRLGSLLDELKQGYLYVLLYFGPASLRLAESFSRHCDGSYFLLHLGESDRVDVAKAVDRFAAIGSQVNGCVVTNVPVDDS